MVHSEILCQSLHCFSLLLQVNATHDAVGHEVVPLEFAAVVLHAVELLDLRDVVLELHGQRHRDAVRRARPRARVQDLYVDRV